MAQYNRVQENQPLTGNPTAMPAERAAPPTFDGFADNYDEALNQGLAVSGEDKDFFASKRVAWLAGCLRRFHAKPQSILDFGCGTGSATPVLLEAFQPRCLTGVDPSSASIHRARQTHGSGEVQFDLVDERRPDGQIDLAFCNGVFHHIPPPDRPAAARYVFASLRSGGWFAFWENNPWNPGTRYVMSRIPFDREAITLSAPEAKALLRAAGFQVVRTDFLFIFPRLLRWARVLEPLVSRLPLGAQYQVLCRKL